MRLQLVGPMTGYPDWNYPAFREAAKALRESGHEVFSPAETAGGDTSQPRAYYMRASLAALLHAEAIMLLPGWETSAGAKTEMRVALALSLPVFAYSGRVMPEVPDGPDD
jgi:hypothetical protein